MSNSLQPHWPQHARPPYPSPTPEVNSKSCPLSQLCHPTISSSVFPFFSCLSLSQYRVFSNESVLRIRWPKYWSVSFSISPSNEYSGLIPFRMDWLDLLAVQGTLKSLLQHHSGLAQFPILKPQFLYLLVKNKGGKTDLKDGNCLSSFVKVMIRLFCSLLSAICYV